MQALVSVSTVGTYEDQSDQQLASTVQAELEEWFGPSVREWQLLRNYRIPFAQPNQACFLPHFSRKKVSCGVQLLVHVGAVSMSSWLVHKTYAAGRLLTYCMDKLRGCCCCRPPLQTSSEKSA